MVLSWSEQGRTRLRTVPAARLEQWQEWTERYQELRRARARLVKLHAELLGLLDELERARQQEP
jgi:molecular chaperone GrpE (heat shock protein)